MPKIKKTIQRKTSSKRRKTITKKRYFFGIISKVFLTGTIFSTLLYLVTGIIAGPQILKQDIEEKYGQVLGAAVNVSALVRGKPLKPVVIATPGCDGYYPYIDLDWEDDVGVDTFDIYRNGIPLVTGLTTSSYRDNNVNTATTYSYFVVAHGPGGNEQSDEAIVTTKTECYIPSPPPPPPNLTITRIDYIDLTNFRCLAQTNKKKSTFWGTTNLANARIAVEIRSRRGIRMVASTFYANANGYWSWRSKGRLKKGIKTIHLTAYDSVDPTRFATASLRFQVKSKKPSKKFLKKCRVTNLLMAGFGENKPLRISPAIDLNIEKNTKIIHAGEEINFSLSYPSLKQVNNFQIEIFNNQEELVALKSKDNANKIKIDKNWPAGKYKLVVRLISDGVEISAEDDFEVKEKPLLVLSSGYEITSRQILSHLGWASLLSLGLMGMFLPLLFFEYYLSKRALFRITESDLKGRGMID